MNIKKVHQWEQATVQILNLLGWNLKWTGENFSHFDASGFTPKGFPCVIEMKFRKKYYENKLLEKYKYDKLMALDQHIVKLYFVADPRGNYFFWLNELAMDDLQDVISCPKSTLWNGSKINKDVYLLPEELASKLTIYPKEERY